MLLELKQWLQTIILVSGITSLMKKIEHIGIAVKDIDTSNAIFEKIFKKTPYKLEKVESEGVITSFFEIGNKPLFVI